VPRNVDPTPGARRSAILRVAVTPARPLTILAVALLAVALAACGGASAGGSGDGAKRSAAQRRSAAARLARAPTPLRVNASDANKLAGEGTDALEVRLAKLKGHPVVINEWASWCAPCRAEFPLLADAVAEHGDKIAFLGIDFTDDREAANEFLGEVPPGFASIYDPKGEAARSLGGGRIAPSTFFIDRDGKRTYTKLGGYANAAALEADIRRHAL
jgi:thiol-disulfide isomerase/thioredoxin